MAAEGASQRQAIIRTAIILTILTAFEFFIAFTWRPFAELTGMKVETALALKNALFVILTIVKAFYIIGEFMHLKHEVKRLAWTILLPFAFIVWLIIGLLAEGNYWGSTL